MEVNSEHLWGIPEIWDLKPDVVVPAHMISDERQTRKGSNVVTVRQYSTNNGRVTTRHRVDWCFVLADCEDKAGVVVHPTPQVAQLPLILHFK